MKVRDENGDSRILWGLYYEGGRQGSWYYNECIRLSSKDEFNYTKIIMRSFVERKIRRVFEATLSPLSSSSDMAIVDRRNPDLIMTGVIDLTRIYIAEANAAARAFLILTLLRRSIPICRDVAILIGKMISNSYEDSIWEKVAKTEMKMLTFFR